MEKDLEAKDPVVEVEGVQKDTKKKIKLVVSAKTAIVVAVVIVVGVLIFQYKGLFIVASVDGSFISRMEVIKELEKLSGEATLDSIVTERLINNKADSMGVVVSDEEINTEIKNIENQIIEQGGTLETVLLSQGMTVDNLREQIEIQKKLEKILSDKIEVSTEEVDQYIEANGADVSGENEGEYREFVENQLKQQKFNNEISVLIDSLRLEAKIKYFREY